MKHNWCIPNSNRSKKGLTQAGVVHDIINN